ncbi:DUF3224 domain-containing protein [Rhodanobacter sp. MP7CTX1]|jgi:Protein of unknown function (DUF3224)|uniref:DUF3224 domain-containing protein n=1 Tax=Rhodanobacter sp. MP7CTX1 TaxID=2723084 RepID=UPI00160E09E1|nr:DUF3224 domain-containing protein [Rhodanobacter sp. MP7CTX1]MBB6189672.1 hypothetical protein [Rhodanobacter sp. MP7CTX1]
MHAKGTFEVKMAPQPAQEGVGDASIGRMALDKQYSGDLEATAKGQMLATRSPVEGSAGYVALERISGALHGRRGEFALQHNGTMTRGVPQLTVTVVPDSGTGELLGLAGTLTITQTDGKHFYDIEYTLPDAG